MQFELWGVFTPDGTCCHVTHWKNDAHEHINDAIFFGDTLAATYVVRQLVIASGQPANPWEK